MLQVNEIVKQTTHQVIRASAGTGKTYRLVYEYINLLLRGAKVEQILATTFTRKAAGEILERVLLRLAEAASDQDETQKLAKELKLPTLTMAHLQQILSYVCRSLHRLNISTLDSFFTKTAQSFRYELGIAPNCKILEETDPIISKIQTQAICAMIRKGLQNNGDEKYTIIDAIRRLHHDEAKRSIVGTLANLMGNLKGIYENAPNKLQWDQYGNDFQLLSADEIKGILCVLDSHAQKSYKDKRYPKSLLKMIEDINSDKWHELLGKGILQKIAEGKDTFWSVKIHPELLEVLPKMIEHILALTLSNEALRTKTTYDLLHAYDQHYRRLLDGQQALLFTDLPRKLSMKMAVDDPNCFSSEIADSFDESDDAIDLMDMYYRLDGQVQHLMLDEFQDTGRVQWDVLKPIADEINANHDGSRTFFCVGDMKQAIYGWRGGCAEIFKKVTEDYVIQASDLFLNFRSSQIILDAVNDVFLALATNQSFGEYQQVAASWASGFKQHEAYQKELGGYIELSTYAVTEAELALQKVDEKRDALYRVVVDKIEALLQVTSTKTIGVLVRTKKSGKQILDLLKEKGIDASGEGGCLLVDDSAVEAVLAAIKFADHPADKAAAYHLCHSPLAEVFGLTNHDYENHLKLTQLSCEIRLQFSSYGYADVLAKWIGKLGDFCDNRNAMRLTQLVELAGQYDEQQTLRPKDFIQFVEAKFVEQLSSCKVRVMTIHKSKGLEFDAVFLPELNGKLADVSKEQAYVTYETKDDDQGQLVEDPLSQIKAVYRSSKKEIRQQIPFLQEAYDATTRRHLVDEICLLYVAMTRAKQALYLFVFPPKVESNDSVGPVDLGALTSSSLLLNTWQSKFDLADFNTPFYSRGNVQWYGDAIDDCAEKLVPKSAGDSEEPKRVALKVPSTRTRSLVLVAPSQKGKTTVLASKLLDVSWSVARMRGTVIHGWFEQIKWLPAALPENEKLYSFAKNTIPHATDKQVAQWINEFTLICQKNGVEKALTKPQFDEVELWRERSFVVNNDSQVMRGQFDRVVVEYQNGEPVSARIIDYKTDRVNNEQHRHELVDHYQPQIEMYLLALEKMLHMPCSKMTAALLFVNDGIVCEVAS